MNSPSWMCYGRGLVKTHQVSPRQPLEGLVRVWEPLRSKEFIRDLRFTHTGQQAPCQHALSWGLWAQHGCNHWQQALSAQKVTVIW